MIEILTVDKNHEALRSKAKPVIDICINLPVVQEVISHLKEASRQAGGLGMAAPQLGYNERIFVLEPRKKGDKQIVVVNPRIVATSGKVTSYNEGCLSVPGRLFNIKRAKHIILLGKDEEGNDLKIKTRKSLDAIIIQHEVDHLNGVLVCDK